MTRAGYDQPLRMTVEPQGAAHVVTLAGAASMYDAEKLQSDLLALINRDVPNLVLDVSQLGFISSIGLGALIVAGNEADKHGGRVRLVNPAPEVARVLDVTRVNRILEVHPTVEGALQSLPGDA